MKAAGDATGTGILEGEAAGVVAASVRIDARDCREMAAMAASDPAGLARLLERLADRFHAVPPPSRAPAERWEAQGPRPGGAFVVRREYGCINGLTAWFAPVEVAVDEDCVLMTDGAIDDAATLAAKVAVGLDVVEALGLEAARALAAGGLGRIA